MTAKTEKTKKRKLPRVRAIHESEVPDAIAKMKEGGPRVIASIRLKGVGRGK